MGKQIPGLAAWLTVTFIAAATGSAASLHAKSFYAELARPEWSPPAYIFGPVWTVLYVLMAVAAWLVWRNNGFKTARAALSLYVVQLALNALWSWLFFAWRLGAPAFADIVVLWILILLTMVAFWRRRATAGWLMVPYFLWVSFALALNYSIWQLNPLMLR